MGQNRKLKKFRKKRHNESSSPIQTNAAPVIQENVDEIKENGISDQDAQHSSVSFLKEAVSSLIVDEGDNITKENETNDFESEAVTDVKQPNINAFNELLKNIDHLKNVSVDEQQPATISNLSGSQVSQTQFDSGEQLKSAFAAYEENQ